MATSSSVAAIRAEAARVLPVLVVLFWVLLLLLILERFSAPTLTLIREGVQAWRALALAAVRALPEAMFLMALSGVWRAVSALAQGQVYAQVLATVLHRVGLWLALGAAVRALALPSMERALGSDPGYLVAYDIGAVVLGAVGLSLTVLARVFAHARALRDELSEIF